MLSDSPNAGDFASPVAVMLGENHDHLLKAYPDDLRKEIAGRVRLLPVPLRSVDLLSGEYDLSDVRMVFTTWGMPELSDGEIDAMPKLEIVFYAAGSVKCFALPLLRRGIRVASAAPANATSVAEYLSSAVNLACKGFFRNARDMRSNAADPFVGPGNCGTHVGFLGCGQVARRTVARLSGGNLDLLAYDPYLDEADAGSIGVSKATIEEIFSRCFVICNCLPDIPETRETLDSGLFSRMLPGAVFINIGRGTTVAEKDLVGVLSSRRDITAILDVTWPEPPAAGSPLRKLDNVVLTSHIAGSLGDEIRRMGEYEIAEFIRFLSGDTLCNEVFPERLPILA